MGAGGLLGNPGLGTDLGPSRGVLLSSANEHFFSSCCSLSPEGLRRHRRHAGRALACKSGVQLKEQNHLAQGESLHSEAFQEAQEWLHSRCRGKIPGLQDTQGSFPEEGALTSAVKDHGVWTPGEG